MAQTNITTEQEQIELREIRRNSSKQIVSYTLEEDSDKDYGYHKVPGKVTKYDAAVYDRTIDQLSNELFVTIPDIPTEIVEQKFVDESNVYEVIDNTLVSIGEEPPEEFEDVFSGRYELTPNAPSFRVRYGWNDNTHYSGISYYSGEVADDTDDYIRFPGFKEIYWDRTVFGPPLSEGGYRITKELIDTGRDIQINATVGMCQGNDNEHTEINQYVRINRKRIPGQPNFGLAEVGGLQSSANGPQYPMFNVTYVLKNEDMVEGDLIEIQTKTGSRNKRNFIYGDKSIFEVILLELEQDSIPYPSGTTQGDGPLGGLPTNLEEGASADASADR